MAGTGACAGEMCVAPAANTCVYATGSQSCPTGYPVSGQLYAGLEDDRYCTKCTCGFATDVLCVATAALYTDNVCGVSNEPITVSGDGGCVSITTTGGGGSFESARLIDAGTASGGSCSSVDGGGEAVGTVVGTGVVTVCRQR